jgi:hypothetical protein
MPSNGKPEDQQGSDITEVGSLEQMPAANGGNLGSVMPHIF